MTNLRSRFRDKERKGYPTAIIKATDDASYMNLIDADEMQICNIGKYVITDIGGS